MLSDLPHDQTMSPESPTQTTPTHESSAPVLCLSPGSETSTEEEPLYTEINIPLPRLASPVSPPSTLPPALPPTNTCSDLASPSSDVHNGQQERSRPRSRARSLSLFRPRSLSLSNFSISPRPTSLDQARQSTSSSSSSTSLILSHQSKRGRSGTVDALAVVPAVLMLRAELFTPGVHREGRGL
jgi:hypothetical protein